MAEYKSDNSRIARNTIYLYVRLVIGLCISVYTSRAFLDALGVQDFGIYNVVGGFVSMLSLFTMTITSAAQRFITYELGTGNALKLRQTFSTFLTTLLLLSIFIIIIGEVFGVFFLDNYLIIPKDRINAAYVVFQCSLIAFIVELVSVPYVACVTAHERMNFYAIVSIGKSVLSLVIVWLLYLTTFDRLETYAILLVCVGIIIRIIYSIYCTKHFEEVKGKLCLESDILKEVFSYSVWVTIGASSAILKEQGVNILINRFFGVAMNTARGISVQVMGMLNQFANGISQAIAPQITKSYAVGDLERSIQLTFTMTKAQGLLLYLIALPLLLETEFILDLWLKDVPAHAVIFTRWAIVLCIARTLENTHGPLFLATGRVRNLQIIAGGLMLLNLPLSYIALKFGTTPEATMMIGVAMELIVMAVIYIYLKKMINFPMGRFYKSVILPMFLVALLSSIAPVILRFFVFGEGVVRFIIVSTVSIISTVIFSYTIALNKHEKGYVITRAKKLLRINSSLNL